MTKLGFIFPGQGSQSLGMLASMASEFSIVEQTFKEASEVLEYDLWQIVQSGPEEKLNETMITQPAMLAAGVSIWRVWQSCGGAAPNIMAGHSLGEYTALVCAEAIAFKDAIGLVEKRAQLMQSAVPIGQGAMAAIIGLEDTDVIQLCKDNAGKEVLEPANFNAVGQVVIAGDKSAVDRAVGAAKASGAKMAKTIPVSVPSHCSLMKPASEKFAEYILSVDVVTPRIPVINNVDARIEQNPTEIKEALICQLFNPVRWVDTIRLMAEDGVHELLECGPGKVLTGLVKRIDRQLQCEAIESADNLRRRIYG